MAAGPRASAVYPKFQASVSVGFVSAGLAVVVVEKATRSLPEVSSKFYTKFVQSVTRSLFEAYWVDNRDRFMYKTHGFGNWKNLIRQLEEA